MATNIINARLGCPDVTVWADWAWQYDYGQILKVSGVDLPDAYEVHFSNQETGGVTITQIGNADGVTVPDELLLSGADIFVWIFLHAGLDDGETVYKIVIPVKDRPQPSDEEPTPVEHSEITQTIAALNTAAEKAEDEAERAESAADLLSHPDAVANTLAPGSSATASYANGTFTFGIPQGLKGDRGEQGVQGEKGDKGDTGETGATGAKGDPGEGIATGGTPGQVLVKSSNTDYATRWMDILPEDTASGSVASFPDGADDLPMGVVVDIDPVQDLHGYDNPWPAGGGKNKCPLMPTTTVNGVTFTQRDDGGYGLSGTANGNSVLDIGRGSWTLPAGTYYGSVTGTSNASSTIWKIVNGTDSLLVTGDGSFTLTETASVFFRLFIASGTTASGIAYVQVESGSTATSYAPYSNICPISGWTQANVTRTGRNVLSKPFIYYNSEVDSKDNSFYLPKGNYTFSFDSTIETSWRFNLRLYNLDGTEVTTGLPAGAGMVYRESVHGFANGVNTTGKSFSFILDKNCYARILFWSGSTSATSTFNGTQLELGSTAHAYEPYTAVTHEIPFSTSVYGGKLNVETGELVVDRAMVHLGTLNYGYNATYKTFSAYKGDIKPHGMCISSQYKYGDGVSAPDMSCCLGYNGWFVNNIVIKDSRYTNAGVFKTAVSGVQLCYELATPITTQLTPTEIRSLLGDNNVWSDTGNTSVTYKADIQKYIDKKISAAVAAMS